MRAVGGIAWREAGISSHALASLDSRHIPTLTLNPNPNPNPKYGWCMIVVSKRGLKCPNCVCMCVCVELWTAEQRCASFAAIYRCGYGTLRTAARPRRRRCSAARSPKRSSCTRGTPGCGRMLPPGRWTRGATPAPRGHSCR